MKYFITGATGFIGGRIVRQLAAAGLVEAMIIAQQITGIPPPRFHLNPIVAKALAEIMSLIGAAIPLPPAYSGEGLRSSAGVTYIGSNEKAKRELGFTVRPLEEGLRETLAYEMERP